MNPIQYCPVCGLGDQNVEESDHGNRLNVRCRRCGQFEISREAAGWATKNDFLFQLSAWIRNRNELSNVQPKITRTNVEDIVSEVPKYSVSDKQRIILSSLERKTALPGDEVELTFDLDFPLAWAASANEFAFLLSALVERRLIDGPERFNNPWCSFVISPTGWDALDEMRRTSHDSRQAFVAMAFAKELISVWRNGIKPALERVGYRAYRVDDDPHIGRIDAKIMTEIKNSKFVLADVTNQRPGVYFEAGYAIGLGLPVIWSVHEDDLRNVHFDTRQYNHIVWKDADDLEQQLYNRVSAVIGRPDE